MKIPTHTKLSLASAVLILACISLLAIAQENGGTTSSEVARGIHYTHVKRTLRLSDGEKGPLSIHLLKLAPKLTRMKFVRAMDQAVGLETVSSLAARWGAVAAVNGGYFRTTGVFRGESTGTFLINGKLVSEPHNDRAALGFIEGKGEFELVIGHLRFSAKISTRKSSRDVSGFNRPLAADELIVFTPQFHRTTLTIPDGVEVVIRRNRIVAVRDQTGSNVIPEDGLVISATGRAREWALANLQVGSSVALDWKLIPLEPELQLKWARASNVVGAGPQLIKGGKVVAPKEHEKFAPAFVNNRHPRTALARLSSGEILLVVVDGRQPKLSVGMTLPELTQLLLEFGATDAINLDGGGSTTMVVKNNVMNKPSDQTGERPVSDAILVFTR